MTKARRVALLAVVALLAFVTPAWSAKDKVAAKEKDKKAAPGSSGGGKSLPPGVALNACGCYKNAQGACVCTDRKAKCECPGDCEPVGCEERRQKDLEKEYEAEVKRAEDEDKKRKAAEEAAAAAAAGGDSAAGEGEEADAGAAEPAPKKPAARGARKDKNAKK